MNQPTQVRRLSTTLIILLAIVHFGAIGHAADPGSILINEVMYHPTYAESTNEWIELYNPTDAPIDLAGWTIADRTETDAITPDPIRGTDTTLPPDSYAILTDHGTTVYETFTIPDAALRLSVDDSTLCGSGLNNQHESLSLYDDTGNLIDCMEWGADYDDIPGTPATLVPTGHSLARIPGQDTDDSATDFIDNPTPTPGAPNTPTDTTKGSYTTAATSPVRITQAYYDAHPGVQDEFIAVTNPTNASVDLTSCYLTDEPAEPFEIQAKLQFPAPSIIPANTTWVITENATWYAYETGSLPAYEWTDARPDIPGLLAQGTVSLSNTGGSISLNDPTGACIDLICYGDAEPPGFGWNGTPIPACGEGVVLFRNVNSSGPIDTDTAADWTHPRVFHIGQSHFLPITIASQAEIIPFTSPDCSYPAITSEIRNATASLRLNMYEFTNVPLASELIAAVHRGVNVSILLEGAPVGGITDTEQAIAATLIQAGAHLRFLHGSAEEHVYTRYRFDHAKYLIVDGTTLVLTSGNWAFTGVPVNPTYGNREWGIVIRDTQLSQYFTDVFTVDFDPSRCDSASIEAMNFTAVSLVLPSSDIPTGTYHPQFHIVPVHEPSKITPVLSPDTSETLVLQALQNATQSIYIQQLEMSLDWEGVENPFVTVLEAKASEGLDVRLFLNDNPSYESSSAADIEAALNGTGIKVQRCITDQSPFTAIHNKGVIIDNRSVLISSVNWNEVSVRENREAAVLVENPTVASYFAAVYLADWGMSAVHSGQPAGAPWGDFKNLILIVVVVTVAALFIAYDWRRRRW